MYSWVRRSVSACASVSEAAIWSACSRFRASSSFSSLRSATRASNSSVETSPALSATRGELVAFDGIVQVLGILEQGPERDGSTADERPQRHVGEAGSQPVELGFLLDDASLGLGDLDVELGLGVDRLVVVLAELAGTLLEPFEFVDDVLDSLTLLVDALRSDDGREGDRDGEGDGEGDGNSAQELLQRRPHSSRAHPTECDERVANG